MLGMKSRNVCVMDIATKKTMIEMIGRFVKEAREPVMITAIRLIWIPGSNPVKVPAMMPRKSAMIISKIILVRFIYFNC